MIDLARLAHTEHDEVTDGELALAWYAGTETGLSFGAPWKIDAIFLEDKLCKRGAIKS